MGEPKHNKHSGSQLQTNLGGLHIREDKDSISFHVFVLPKSSKNMVVGVHDGALKLKLTAPPVDNAANTLCIAFLAKSLGLSKSSLDIVSGHTNRNKQIRISCPGNKSPEQEKADIKAKILTLFAAPA